MKQYDYMLLSRLLNDCYGFIDYGRRLWGGNAQEHMAEMFKLWDGLQVKPKWLTRKELIDLNQKVLSKAA